MSRISSMHAGAANTSYGANSMLVQIGDKLQGLPPTTNKPARLINHITTRAEGDKRDYIFCINQLAGGVGKGKGQFAVGADGVKDCTTGKYKPKVDCDFIRLDALQSWVQTELSSLYATIAQGAGVVTTEALAENFFSLAIVPSEMLTNGTSTQITGTSGSTGTITSYMTDISHLRSTAAFLNHVNSNGGTHPYLDLSTFIANGSGAPTNIVNFSANTITDLTVAQLSDFTQALANSLSANPEVKATINSIANKNIKVDGFSGDHRIVVSMFSEQFVQTALFSDMRQWFTNATASTDRIGSAIWFAYEANPAFNGAVNTINNQQIISSNQHYRTNFTFFCDIDGVTIPGSSTGITDGNIHINNTFPPTNTITHLSNARFV